MGYVIKFNGKRIDEMTTAERAEYDRVCKRKKAEFDDMVKTGRGLPLLHTDDTLRTAWNNANGNQFADCPEYGDSVKEIARKAGVSTTGKTYLSSLARKHGDPKAWVDGKGDIRRVAEEGQMRVEGAVNVNHLPEYVPPDPKKKRLAPDIVRKLGGTTPEKAEAIIDKHGFAPSQMSG